MPLFGTIDIEQGHFYFEKKLYERVIVMNKNRNSKHKSCKLPGVLVFFGLVLIVLLAIAVILNNNFKCDTINSGNLFSSPQHQSIQNSSVSAESWQLILVNRWNQIPEDYEVNLTYLDNNQAVDSRIYPYLQEMLDDARADGILPEISSSYRTAEEQQAIMDEKIDEYCAEGYSDWEAKELAEKWVAIPNTSEHQIGLAVDITTVDSAIQDASVVWQWLSQNSYKYGFIVRYPENKTDITGVINEQWHYRYVGKEAAKEIYESGMCLEEYLTVLNNR